MMRGEYHFLLGTPEPLKIAIVLCYEVCHRGWTEKLFIFASTVEIQVECSRSIFWFRGKHLNCLCSFPKLLKYTDRT